MRPSTLLPPRGFCPRPSVSAPLSQGPFCTQRSSVGPHYIIQRLIFWKGGAGLCARCAAASFIAGPCVLLPCQRGHNAQLKSSGPSSLTSRGPIVARCDGKGERTSSKHGRHEWRSSRVRLRQCRRGLSARQARKKTDICSVCVLKDRKMAPEEMGRR